MLTRVRRTNVTLPRDDLHKIPTPMEGKMHNIDLSFSNELEGDGLSNELGALKIAVCLLATKLPIFEARDIAASLRGTGIEQSVQQADLIDSFLDKMS